MKINYEREYGPLHRQQTASYPMDSQPTDVRLQRKKRGNPSIFIFINISIIFFHIRRVNLSCIEIFHLYPRRGRHETRGRYEN